MSAFHPLYPPTRILSATPLPQSEAHTFLQTFLHWTSTTRPIRNRKHPYNSLHVVPFPHSVLNNLRRIEMGLRGERAPRIKAKNGGKGTAKVERKRKWDADGETIIAAAAVETAEEEVGEGDEYSEGVMDVEEEKEIQIGGREMRNDGEVVDEAPRVLTEESTGGMDKRSKEERKKEKKARRKGEKKVREEKRRKGKNGEE